MFCRLTNRKMLIPAILTLLDNNEHFQKDAEKKLIELLIRQGADALYVGGSTGCAPLLPMNIRKQLIETTTECVNGRIPVIAYTGFIDSCQTEELTKFAAECGVDAVSSVPPYYYSFSFDEIYQFYDDFASSSPLPVIIYYLQNLNSPLGVDQMTKILQISNVEGIKYTSTNQNLIIKIKENCPDKTVFSGCDEQLFNGLFFGADGAIGTTYNVFCDVNKAIIQAFENDQLQEAKKISCFANKLISTVNCNAAWMSAFCRLLYYFGIDAPTVRRPFSTMNDTTFRSMVQQLKELGKVPGAECCEILRRIEGI